MGFVVGVIAASLVALNIVILLPSVQLVAKKDLGFRNNLGTNLLNLRRTALQTDLHSPCGEACEGTEIRGDTLVPSGRDTLVREPGTLWSGRLYL